MDITIVIGVRDDLKIRNCLDSIDEKVEVILSLNDPTPELLNLVNDILQQKEQGLAYQNLEIVVYTIDYPSIAGAYNNGILKASYQEILLMDSDCTFEKGCIRKLHQALGHNFLSKGLLVYSYQTFLHSIVARAREFHATSSVNAYKPGILLKKDIIKHIDGYYFHPSLCWLEDSEFDSRVQKAGLKISYDPSAITYHAPLTVRRDLRSAFWYGVGKRIGVRLGLHRKPTGLAGSVRKYIFEGSKQKGIFTGLYLFVWKLTLLLGFYVQAFISLRPEIISPM